MLVQERTTIGCAMEDISPEAKAWVYTSKNELTTQQQEVVLSLGETFLNQWQSHGKQVKGAIHIVENRFIVVFADPQGDDMCGRAQDASVRFIKELEEVLEATLMDRMLVAYTTNTNTIDVLPFHAIKDMLKAGDINATNTFYNSLIQTKEEFLTNWVRPIEGSWLAI